MPVEMSRAYKIKIKEMGFDIWDIYMYRCMFRSVYRRRMFSFLHVSLNIYIYV